MKENEDDDNNINNNINGKHFQLTEDDYINTNDQDSNINAINTINTINTNYNKKEEVLDMKKNKDK